ncbi:DUF3145 domain-containing protein [Rhodococcus rhodnii]|uniref:DUF3145 domain-containing protein n=2 Tax=Rhodococcus rhodnii TaxID=38312 RepID=R7WLB5_9NOCA|nr:DUF3145 domain-containing protein [Rhodococcus rhodnii]EOM76080.1 hypothetical protein Rrhod_2609 [Rhodococcus rhodnii LMG 5362]TXG92784.1 DUF3145 domain-containing protein [Rhodococcus rhodnii]
MHASRQFADTAAGVVYVHAAAPALCPHVEWALAGVLDSPPNLKWTAQPAAHGVLRATADWRGPVGTASRLVRALAPWPMLRYEVTEDPTEGVDGVRFSYVPDLGLWQGTTSACGDVVLGEMRLRALLAQGGDVATAIRDGLGEQWDDALEPYRSGGEGAEVTWLRRDVG